ncbi:MAG: flavodoxin family protein [Saccharofermentanales bacterium]
MRVLGMSMGRVNGNSELLLKHALKAVQEEGHEVSFVRLHDYKIKPCVGCELCTMYLSRGEEPRCKYGWEEDDIKFLMDQVKASQALILAAPAYHLMPPGIGTVLLNRIHSCGCDNHTGRRQEDDVSKRKICATIGVGGSDWCSLLMPILNFTATELIGSQMNLVDQMSIHGCPSISMVALLQEALDRATQLGKNVAAELNGDSAAYYHGTADETCSICHTNILLIQDGRVRCPICDVAGDLVIKDGKIDHIAWDGGIESSRWSKFGVQRHDDVQTSTVKLKPGKYVYTDEQKQKIAHTVAKWKNYLPPVQPSR